MDVVSYVSGPEGQPKDREALTDPDHGQARIRSTGQG